MAMTFRRYEEIKKIEEAMKKDPKNLPEREKTYVFTCISKYLNVYSEAYLYKDYENASPDFKKALADYENIVRNFDLDAYRSYSEGSGGSTTMMIGIGGATLFANMPLGGSSGGSTRSLIKLYKAEKKLRKLEEKEGIKRLSSLDYAKLDAEYERKLQQYVEKNTSKELEK